MSETQAVRTPRHLWIVGIVALSWSLLAAMDFTLLTTRNRWYLSGFTEEQIAHGSALSVWGVAIWAIAVWAGLVGAVLLLMRKKIAVPVLLLSLPSWLVWAIVNHGFLIGGGKDVTLLVPAGIVLAWLIYALSVARKGVLV